MAARTAIRTYRRLPCSGHSSDGLSQSPSCVGLRSVQYSPFGSNGFFQISRHLDLLQQQELIPRLPMHARHFIQIVHNSPPKPPRFDGNNLRQQLQNASAKISGRGSPKGQPSLENTRRLVRFLHLEELKRRLRRIPNDCISYEELLRLCMDSTCNSSSTEEEARAVARLLDESGEILVMGHTVYLHPHRVTRAIQNAMPLSVAARDDPRREEMERMEKHKNEIDMKAERLARNELWCGLGFMTIQTAGFMRLTFWEMSWDVMEPICFFVTATYFLAGYAFFLTTSTEPTFEGVLRARFKTRQSRLMKKKNFDIQRFTELRRTCKTEGIVKSSASRGILDALED